MCSLIGIFFPSVIGMVLIKKLNQNKLRDKDVINYIMLVLFSNIICISLSVFIFGLKTSLVGSLENSPLFFAKYSIISIIFNIIIGIVISIINKHCDLKLETRKRK